MWRNVIWLGNVCSAWQCPSDLLAVYQLPILPLGYIWAQLADDGPYRKLKLSP